MTDIIKFAETKNKDLLIAAGMKLKDSYAKSQLSFNNLLLNHMGCILGIDKCKYLEAKQYISSQLIESNLDKALCMLESLSAKGYIEATEYLANKYCSTDPALALDYYLKCLQAEDVDQGEINENIGYLYFSSDTLETKKAYQYLIKAAEKYNRSFSQYILGCMFYNGDGVEQNLNISFSYCLSAANNGEERAEFLIGKNYIFADEYPLEQDIGLGLKYLKSAAQKGNYNALYILGFMYYDGDLVEKDVIASEDYLKQAIQGNIPGAYAYLGKIYFDRSDFEQAKKYFEIAHNDSGTLLWLEYLVKIYKDGLLGNKDTPKAIALIEEMIENNASNAEDVRFIADSYYYGNGVEKNIDKAVKYYSILEHENPEIRYILGCIAAEGESSLLSKNDCIYYFEYAGNHGIPKAFSNLAHFFITINNKDRALDYFKRSFNSGNYDDGVMVGKIYENGTPSINKNMNEAVNWYKLAADMGSLSAKDELSYIKSGLFGYKRI